MREQIKNENDETPKKRTRGGQKRDLSSESEGGGL